MLDRACANLFLSCFQRTFFLTLSEAFCTHFNLCCVVLFTVPLAALGASLA